MGWKWAGVLRQSAEDAGEAGGGAAASLLAGGEAAGMAAGATGTDRDGGDGEGQAGADAEAGGYADFDLPEGVSIDPDLLTEFKTALAGMHLRQEQAQLIADLGVKQARSLLARFADSGRTEQAALLEAFKVGEGSVAARDFAQPAVLQQQAAAWAAATRADKELGGDRLGENLAVAKRALDALATPGLVQLLDKTGLGNHPDVVRAFYQAGRLIAEDSLVSGRAAPGPVGRTAHERAAHALYGGGGN